MAHSSSQILFEDLLDLRYNSSIINYLSLSLLLDTPKLGNIMLNCFKFKDLDNISIEVVPYHKKGIVLLGTIVIV